jgi:hypothetical protein
MFLVRWAAIVLLLLEAAAAALYSFLLASVAVAYWQVELTSRRAPAQPHISWLDALTQSALLIAVVVIYVVVPAAIAVGAARRRFWWTWAGVAYQLAWAFLLTPRDRWPGLGRQPPRNRRRRPLPRPSSRAASPPPATCRLIVAVMFRT